MNVSLTNINTGPLIDIKLYFASSHYQVIVQGVNDWADELPEKNTKKLLDYDKSQKEKQGFYIAAELQSELIHPSLTFEIGDGKHYGTYKNVALAKLQKYKIYIRAVTTSPKVMLTTLPNIKHVHLWQLLLVHPGSHTIYRTSSVFDILYRIYV